MRAFIVKSENLYLYPSNGDVSWTLDKSAAGHFLSVEEVTSTMDWQKCPFPYEIIPVEVEESELVRQ